jgi:hypothetical protein
MLKPQPANVVCDFIRHFCAPSHIERELL